MVKMRCPYCSKKIGTEENPFGMDSVTFERPKGKDVDIFPIYCSSCGKVIGVV